MTKRPFLKALKNPYRERGVVLGVATFFGERTLFLLATKRLTNLKQSSNSSGDYTNVIMENARVGFYLRVEKYLKSERRERINFPARSNACINTVQSTFKMLFLQSQWCVL